MRAGTCLASRRFTSLHRPFCTVISILPSCGFNDCTVLTSRVCQLLRAPRDISFTRHLLPEQPQYGLTNNFACGIVDRAIELAVVLNQLLQLAVFQVLDLRLSRFAVRERVDLVRQRRGVKSFHQWRHFFALSFDGAKRSAKIDYRVGFDGTTAIFVDEDESKKAQ